MTAGQPRATISRADQQTRAHAQATQIHELLARNVPHRDVAAAVGCTVHRVAEVARQPVPAPLDQPWDDDEPSAVPSPRSGGHDAATGRTGPGGGTWDTLLSRGLRDDDPRIRAVAEHIRGDLNALRSLLAVAADREQHAVALVAADRRREALDRVYAQRHPQRRRTDRQEAS